MGNPSFGPVQDRVRQQILDRFFQDPFAGQSLNLHFARNSGRELDQHMIEKRHPAFDGRGHAHVVLLHEQFDQISLDVGVEQPLQHLARGVVPVIEHVLIGRAGRGFARELAGQQSALLRFAEGGKEIIEVERSPGISILGKKSMFEFAAQSRSQKGRGRDRIAQSAPQKRPERRCGRRDPWRHFSK